MKERANDIEDIKNRIVRNLRKKRWQSRIKGDVIIVSDSLTPADALLLSRNNVKSFITDHGGLTSHAAIISRSLNIPALMGSTVMFYLILPKIRFHFLKKNTSTLLNCKGNFMN